MTAPALTYYRPPRCWNGHGGTVEPLPALRNEAGQFLSAGTPWTCPSCNRAWIARHVFVWGGVMDVQWFCDRAPNVPDPMAGMTAQVAALTDQYAALATRMAAQEAKTVTEHIQRVPTVALIMTVGATQDYTITWNGGGFTDAVYAVDVALPTALIGKVTWAVKSGTQTKTGVTIRLTATSAVTVAIGSDLLVAAIRYAA